jgi:RNA polymerase sigma-70 factor (sigma-E family)
VTIPVEVPMRVPGPRPEASTRPGDDEFDAWATAAGPGLLRFAEVVAGNPHDAADAVQDALTAIYPRWSRLTRAGATPDAYARRAIANHRISWWRRIGRREALGADLPDATTGGPDPDGHGVLELLRDLPPRQRAAIALRYLDDLSFAEVARILDCPEATARSYVHRALQRLRTQLDTSGGDRDE